MFKIKYIVMLVLLFTSLVRAELLQTSDELSNLEIVTDTDCPRNNQNVNTIEQEAMEEKVPSELKVETVNYELHACDGVASFPVTVRSNKMRGNN